MTLEQIWAVRFRVIWTALKFDEVMLSNLTLGPSYRPIHFLSSSPFHKPLAYYNFGQVTAIHGSSIVTTKFSQTTQKVSDKVPYRFVTSWLYDFARFHADFEKEHPGGQGHPASRPLPPTSRKDLQSYGYLRYPPLENTLYIYKHPCLPRDSNPVPTHRSHRH
ncbi:hypothetical protein TNCV_1124921 [Trichonephila clavipes]|uniref:Uncharacterized protein n=1 Tax=Trichonephila clavipes TaxID=2585209 RepID=A0A8X6SMC4_TRICX|nr:hypothetical protein TNCV_1124921 [Trichonephila clavipes]